MTLQLVAIAAQRRDAAVKYTGQECTWPVAQSSETTENSWLCPAQVPAPLPANRSAEEATDELH
jgi:hypothetical protein